MSGPASEFFDAERLEALFDEVDVELGDGEPVRVIACGSAVMVFKYDIRRTNDVDVISEPFPLELRQATETVARCRGLAEGWMNDAAKISVPRLAPRLETIYQGRRLEVLSPGPHFLLAMKLAAGRRRGGPCLWRWPDGARIARIAETTASVTSGYLPSPMLVTFLLIRTRCAQVFDTRLFTCLRTSRLSPYLPRPSP